MNLNNSYEAYKRDPLLVDEFALELKKFITGTVKQYCLRKSASTFSLLEDAIGDSLLKVWEHLGTYDPTKEAVFTTWVTTCVYNNIVDIFRKYKNRQELLMIDNVGYDSGKPDFDLGDRLTLDKIRRQLSKEDQNLITFKLQGLSDEVIAANFGQSVGNMKTIWRRLKAKMKLLSISDV